ncbi:MAG: GTP 3',8-cyclase MoaA [Oscillospiraceae bacterium]|nr:GTP 3',8-cyclase MoaA [Oscillospiraceae bacterium]MBQ9411876.1 GTP 3',8-cyclase MoaA [Oscillospiraceae bacterium]
MRDGQGREIDYIRISVTDRCNLRCQYCMPAGGVRAFSHDAVLRFEEIDRLMRCLSPLGFRHLRLTGGEPMVRRGCLDLVRTLRTVPGVESVTMTSNGLLLSGRVAEAKAAGLSALNLSLDSLDPGRYAELTRGGVLALALGTMEEALELGLPLKLNCVPLRGRNEEDLIPLAELARERAICVRFIELMPIGCGAGLKGIPQAELTARLEAAFGPMEPDPERHGWGPARYYRPRGFVGSVGLIGAVSHAFCDCCNRVRLTADGQLKLCLNHTDGLDLRELLRGGASDGTITAAVADALRRKPSRHAFFEDIGDRELRRMNEIGG